MESEPPGVRSAHPGAEMPLANKMVLSHTSEPQFSQPVRQIVSMLIVLGLVTAVGVLLFPHVKPVFLASLYLNGVHRFRVRVGVGCLLLAGGDAHRAR